MLHHCVAPNWGDCHKIVTMLNTNFDLDRDNAVIGLVNLHAMLSSL